MYTAGVLITGGLFIAAGISQLVRPAAYLSVVPPYLPFPLALIYGTGVLKALGGLGLLVPQTRRPVGWALVFLLVAVFPANVHMALNPQQFADVPPALLIARLPLQLVFIAWVYWLAIRNRGLATSGSAASR